MPFFGGSRCDIRRTLPNIAPGKPCSEAARLGNTRPIRLLLAHGANTNTDYHGLNRWKGRFEDQAEIIPIQFTCGRVVKVATELRGISEVDEVSI